MQVVVSGLVALAMLAPRASQAADTPPLPADLLPVLARPDHRAALLQAAHAADAVRVGACPKASYVTTGEIAVLQPLRLDTHGQPTAGMWKESVRETGCDAPHVLNVLTIVRPDGALDTRPLLPGGTIADPQLQQDSVQYAASAMGDLPPGCDSGGITDTAFTAVDGEPPGRQPPPGEMVKPWTETWTLQACGKRATVTMHFAPDPSGTAIAAALAPAP